MSRVKDSDWARVWGLIEGYFEVDGGRIFNAKMLEEYEKATALHQKRATAGRRGGQARLKPSQSAAEAKLKPGHKVSASKAPSRADSKTQAEGGTYTYTSDAHVHARAHTREEDRPKSILEVVEVGRMHGVPEDRCRAFFHHYDAQGWLVGNNLPMTNWQSKLMTWKNPKPGTTQNGTKQPGVWELKQRLDAINDRLTTLRNRGNDDIGGGFKYASAKDRDEAKKLKASRDKITEQLTSVDAWETKS